MIQLVTQRVDMFEDDGVEDVPVEVVDVFLGRDRIGSMRRYKNGSGSRNYDWVSESGGELSSWHTKSGALSVIVKTNSHRIAEYILNHGDS
jgi:hypothetical protein